MVFSLAKKIITFLLIFAIVAALCLPVFAASGSSLIYDGESISRWNLWFENNYVIHVPFLEFQQACWTVIDRSFAACGAGPVSSREELMDRARLWNKRLQAPLQWGSLAIFCVANGFDSSIPTAQIAFDPELGVYRLQEYHTGLWLVNSAGHFPYYSPSSGDDGSTTHRTGKWLAMGQITGTKTDLWKIVDGDALYTYRSEWADQYSNIVIAETENYYWLVRSDYGMQFVLCTENGLPYIVPKEGKSAITTDRDHYGGEGDSYVDKDTVNNWYDYTTNEFDQSDNSTNVHVQDGGAIVDSIIDLENGTLLQGGEIMYIDSATFDQSTDTYYIDAHTEYTYNSTTNNYVTETKLYVYQFYIDYTSITYIGQTEEYDERYELYYQLPDGRSSADLTVEDLEQLSLVFHDVVNYGRSADDASMRSLYHFDGDTFDSSYWSYCTEFHWNKGASLTYMDEGTFEGSLYLDETEHEFEVILPNAADVSGDFTLQFRYYQSGTLAPHVDSWIGFGSTPVLYLSGASYLGPDQTSIAATSVGVWNELCIMRSSGTLWFYINGVPVHSVADSTVFSHKITFHFGADQQTYKKIDELRFTKAAVYTAGENYYPTSVPFDTNLSLILPDGEYPIADEFMVLTPYSNNLFRSHGLEDWKVAAASQTLKTTGAGDFGSAASTVFDGFPSFVYNPDYTSFVVENGVTKVVSTTGSYLAINEDASGHTDYLTGGLLFALGGYHQRTTGVNQTTSEYWLSRDSNNVNYTLSVVMSDGTYARITVRINDGVATQRSITQSANCTLTLADFTSHTYSSSLGFEDDYHFYGIVMQPSAEAEIVYMELRTGVNSGFTIDWEQAFYSSGQLQDSPILAVRSNQPITGYQIGGVRPSYPTTGLVYALVENDRITSLQQYSGTAWVEVDGRIWTGVRWIPYSSFNVITLQDLWDIIGSTDDYEYIYTESGFWDWFQKAWKNFMDKVDQIIDLLGGSKSEEEEELEEDKDSLLQDFLRLIFKRKDDDEDLENRVTTDDLTDIGTVLDESRGLFNSGFKISQIFDELRGEWFLIWFTPECYETIDSVTDPATMIVVHESPAEEGEAVNE